MSAVSINSFIEDTSVLVAGAFLFVRGPMERITKNGIWLGALAGAFAASEAVFPGDRFPYAPHTLACAFATTVAGPHAGTIAAVVATVVAVGLLPLSAANLIVIQVLLAVLIVSIVRAWLPSRWWCIPAAAVAQLAGIALPSLFAHSPYTTLTSPSTVVANTFGLGLLMVVVRDARLRSDSHRHMHEVDEARRVAAEAQLAIVRTRVQPHFLFNALNSIASLCMISPERASEATVQLGKLMRRSLEFDLVNGLPLAVELETVQSYLSIEQERFGAKLLVEYDIDVSSTIEVPAFSVQILVENAVLHGITPKLSGGKILVTARKCRNGSSVSVADDGVGIVRDYEALSVPHGLTILRQQLFSICGPSARLHVINRPSGGTLAAFFIPSHNGKEQEGVT